MTDVGIALLSLSVVAGVGLGLLIGRAVAPRERDRRKATRREQIEARGRLSVSRPKETE